MLISSHVLSEVAQTVDDVIVIHHGRLVDEGPVDRLSGPQQVSVRSPRLADLAAVIERAGAQVSRAGSDDVLLGIPLLAGKSGPSLTSSDYARAIGGSLLACGLAAMLGVAVGKFLFGNALTAIAGRGNGVHRLAFGPAVAVVLGWTTLALAIAGWVDSRRDIA